MRLKPWIRALALVLVALAAFAAVESVVCAEDMDLCCQETAHCCGCVHTGLVVTAPAAPPQVFAVAYPPTQFESVPAWETEPLFRPPIA